MHYEAKFHVKPLRHEESKVCSNGLGHMTKMAAMTIYGKNPLKIFFSETGRPITLKLGMQPHTTKNINGPRNILSYLQIRFNIHSAFRWAVSDLWSSGYISFYWIRILYNRKFILITTSLEINAVVVTRVHCIADSATNTSTSYKIFKTIISWVINFPVWFLSKDHFMTNVNNSMYANLLYVCLHILL